MSVTQKILERNDKLLTVIIDEFVSDRVDMSNEDLMNDLYEDNINSSVVIVDVYVDWHLPFLYKTIKDMFMVVKAV